MRNIKTLTVKSTASELAVWRREGERAHRAILLHGGPGVPDYLREVATYFPPTMDLTGFDQRGVGNSAEYAGDYSMERYIEDIDAVAAIVGAEKFFLFGHSFGGLLAQIYAIHRPDRIRGMFLCSPSTGVGRDWKRMESAVMAHNRRQASSREWMEIGALSLLGLAGSDGAYRRIFSHVWRYYFRDPRASLPADPKWLAGVRARAIVKTRRSVLQMDSDEFDRSVRELGIPALVVFGDYDIYGERTADALSRLPNAEAKVLADCGHLPWLQQPEEFRRLLEGFFRRSDDEPPEAATHADVAFKS